MTTVFSETVECSVCGHETEQWIMGSTNAFGTPDLDLRPPEMQRSTMDYWVQECENCHYVSDSISDPCPVPMAYIRSEGYLNCDGHAFKSELARSFYRHHKIQMLAGNTEGAFDALLYAAWVCDDLMDKAQAKAMRELCIPLATFLISKKKKKRDNLLLIRADLLRRAGRFDELLAAYENVRFNDDVMNQVLAFQFLKAKERDDACYTVEQASTFLNENGK